VCKSILALCLLAVCSPLLAEGTPEVRLEAGIVAFHARDFVLAESELTSAVQAFAPGSLTAQPAQHARALVYLTLTQSSLGREENARESIARLAEVERTTPVYQTLALGADMDDFESVVAALAPDSGLARAGAAGDESSIPLPAVVPAPVSSVAMPAAATEAQLSQSAALRQAEALADAGQTMEAMRIWSSLAESPASSREVLIESAIGLYEIGAFRQALPVFGRLGVFGRGEEDLRYYYAVVLYETGDFAAARHELACALPYIQESDDVERYRLKIGP
jgi:hypothetical protein